MQKGLQFVFSGKPETILFVCFGLVFKDLETGPVKRAQKTMALFNEL